MLDKPTVIYGLLDPRNGELRYVGKTVNPKKRYNEHVNKKLIQTYTRHWITSLQAQGLQPEFLELDIAHGEAWREAERFYIEYFRYIGCRLTNLTLGGGGSVGFKQSPEACAKKAAIWKGRSHTPETKAKLSAALMGHVQPPAARAKMSKSHTGKKLSDQHKASLGAASRAAWARPEVRARAAAAVAAGPPRSMTEAHKAAIRAANLGRPGPPHVAELTRERQSKNYVVTDPDGRELRIRNLKGFCREQGLSVSMLSYVANGRCEHWRGWRCRHDENQKGDK